MAGRHLVSEHHSPAANLRHPTTLMNDITWKALFHKHTKKTMHKQLYTWCQVIKIRCKSQLITTSFQRRALQVGHRLLLRHRVRGRKNVTNLSQMLFSEIAVN